MRIFAILCVALLSGAGYSQTLAHKNWAGSGVTVEPWWRRAVFYRIDPARFQDSDGDGKGDLAGIAQRLDYLQALGVDALLLDASGNSLDEGSGMPATDGFDDLTRAAVGHHLRLVVALGVPTSQSQASDAQYIALARSWLNQGAAGVYVPTSALAKVDGTYHIAALLHQLRLLTASFPGARVLIAGAPAKPDEDLLRALQKEAQLTASPAILSTTPSAASLRAQLETVLSTSGATTSARGRAVSSIDPLLRSARIAPDQDSPALQRTLAAMLLASRSAVILEYGQELGLLTEGAKAPVMQWTPTNVTQQPAPPAPPPAEAPAEAKPAFEAFREFVPPPRKDLLPPPKMPLIIVSDDPQPAVIDPVTLPGFTAGTLDASFANTNGATANVAMEQADPKSLLNFYRQLIQLHHDNPTVRNGTQTLLNQDAVSAVSWVRRAPSGARTLASVVVICRLGAALADSNLRVTRSLLGTSADVVFIAETR